MRVLMLSTDRNMLDRSSAVFARARAYAARFGTLDVVLCVTGSVDELRDGPLHIRPTNSPSRFLHVVAALWAARTIERPDVVTAQDPFEIGLAGFLIARARGCALHLQVHTDLFSPEFSRGSSLNRFRLMLARFLLPRADGIRVVSGRIKRDITERKLARVPITVLPIYVDVERFKWAMPDAALEERFRSLSPRVLVVSRLEREKNVGEAIRAFAEYAPENACLIIVGDGSERGALEKLAREYRCADRISFKGARDPAPYYKLADLLLVPSLYEGFGLVIAEALAAGKPVLATDVGAAHTLGAIIAPRGQFAESLGEWFQGGPREGRLLQQLYANFDDYVRAYCEDIERAACARPAV